MNLLLATDQWESHSSSERDTDVFFTNYHYKIVSSKIKSVTKQKGIISYSKKNITEINLRRGSNVRICFGLSDNIDFL